MRRKNIFSILLSVCIMLLSSCTNGNNGEVSVSESFSSVSEYESTDVTDEEYGELSSESEDGSETEASEEASETGPDTDISGPDTEPDPQDISETDKDDGTVHSVTAAPTESKTETPKTQAPTEAAVTAAVSTTAPKPPVEVVIPKIKMPEAPGTSLISGTSAEIDYSNASEGYISAVYNGSKSAKIRIKCGSTQYDHDLSSGGKREYFPLMGNGSYSVGVYEQVSGSKYATLASGDFEVTIKNSTGMYLYPNKYIDFSSSSSCVKKAAEVCAGLSDDVEKIAAIFTYTTDNISYDKQLAATVKSGYVPDPDSTLSSKKGICFDYASLFAAMCRSQGIPARLVIGYADPDIYHAWNEVYTDETGWITPELFLKNKGYNIADATFYASNSDKDRIAKYISDDGNYSAIYRY